ncbi:MAG: tyrosine--tRNA ligase, partial [Candidatus Harrisonbacteria bacterium CG10_big_fil_rev_8_21_14_0_10_38_8]
TSKEKIEDILTRGVTEVVEIDNLRKELASGKQLRVKLGFDPTGPNIHIGRAIILRKLKAFQDLGHKVIFIVGDFTAQIGDPSDKLDKRPVLTIAEINKNLKNYKAQVGKIIDLRKAEFKFNSKWLKKLNFQEVAVLAESFTVQQMLARRNFKDRFKNDQEISLKEFLYPIMQGYDSVHINADIEIGGFDQLFNLQSGRVIQKHYNKKPQNILATEMLEGTDGRKMSTSWGNVINITDDSNDMFGKVMSLKDELIDKYFILCTDLTKEEVALISGSPKDRKIRLAKEIVTLYHSKDKAEKASEEFNKVYSKKDLPTEISEVKILEDKLSLLNLVFSSGLVVSKGDARRMITQGAVKINNEKKTDEAEVIQLEDNMIVQVGPRRFSKIRTN